MTSQAKLCEDCQHVDQQGCFLEPHRWRCMSPQNTQGRTSLLNGKPIPLHLTCEDARYSGIVLDSNSCSAEGKWFEPKKKFWFQTQQQAKTSKKAFEIGKDL